MSTCPWLDHLASSLIQIIISNNVACLLLLCLYSLLHVLTHEPIMQKVRCIYKNIIHTTVYQYLISFLYPLNMHEAPNFEHISFFLYSTCSLSLTIRYLALGNVAFLCSPRIIL